MSLPVEDIRHSFFSTLDHFPSDLVRTLWLIQSLDVQWNDTHDQKIRDNLDNTYLHLQKLVQRQKILLKRQRDQLYRQQHIRKRYRNFVPETIEKIDTSISKEEVKDRSIRANTTTQASYCFCHGGSYGRMIACDNDQCPLEWFHYKCVNLTKVPKGEWYCSEKCEKDVKHRKVQSNSKIQKKSNKERM